MEIIGRAEAIKRNLGEYFTGELCKNGHIAKRYTRSGACYLCVHPPIKAVGQENREARIIARRRMIVRKFRVADNDLDTFMNQVLGLALSYDGSLEMRDLQTRGKVFRLCKWAGIYSVRIFPEMEPYLRPLELRHWDERPAGAPPIVVPGDYWPESDPL